MLLDSSGFIVLYSVSVLVHGMGMGMGPQPCAYHAGALHVPVLVHTKYYYTTGSAVALALALRSTRPSRQDEKEMTDASSMTCRMRVGAN